MTVHNDVEHSHKDKIAKVNLQLTFRSGSTQSNRFNNVQRNGLETVLVLVLQLYW